MFSMIDDIFVFQASVFAAQLSVESVCGIWMKYALWWCFALVWCHASAFAARVSVESVSWISIRYEHGTDFSTLFKIIIPIVVLLLIFIYWVKRLKSEISHRKEVESKLFVAKKAKIFMLFLLVLEKKKKKKKFKN